MGQYSSTLQMTIWSFATFYTKQLFGKILCYISKFVSHKSSLHLYSDVVAYSCVWHFTHLLQSLCSTLSLIVLPDTLYSTQQCSCCQCNSSWFHHCVHRLGTPSTTRNQWHHYWIYSQCVCNRDTNADPVSCVQHYWTNAHWTPPILHLYSHSVC